MKKKLASILCDGGEGDDGETLEDYRCDIVLIEGRLICEGNDITPREGRYPNNETGVEQAINDIEAMYGLEGERPWDPQWYDV